MQIDEENYFIMLVLKTFQRTLILPDPSYLTMVIKAKELFEKNAILCLTAVPL